MNDITLLALEMAAVLVRARRAEEAYVASQGAFEKLTKEYEELKAKIESEKAAKAESVKES